jgi:hypothetical protein
LCHRRIEKLDRLYRANPMICNHEENLGKEVGIN